MNTVEYVEGKEVLTAGMKTLPSPEVESDTDMVAVVNNGATRAMFRMANDEGHRSALYLTTPMGAKRSRQVIRAEQRAELKAQTRPGLNMPKGLTRNQKRLFPDLAKKLAAQTQVQQGGDRLPASA